MLKSVSPGQQVVKIIHDELVKLLGEGSTDANIPMSLNIPAITVGTGGHGTDAHALSEAFDTTEAWKGTQNAVLLTIALAR